MKNLTGLILAIFFAQLCAAQGLKINSKEYFEMPGLNVMVFFDVYPEGHQGGISIIQNGTRVATNGDVRLEPTPGQWQPIPKVGARTIKRIQNEIDVRCWFPDTAINRKGFNPIIYPDLHFAYNVRIIGESSKFRILVDLDKPLPAGWEKQVGFNIELFPGLLFGKGWYLDNKSGIFNTQANGPMEKDVNGDWQAFPMATGKILTIAPEEIAQRMKIESFGQPLQLLDGRFYHNNGWFVVRSLVTPGKTKGAIEWLVDASVVENFISSPVVHVSQVGYHPKQEKVAVVELDGAINTAGNISLVRFSGDGKKEVVKTGIPSGWGKFLRFNYFQFNFTEIQKEGIYRLQYGKTTTEPFRISSDVYERHVWQPTLEYFLPVQMCHMRINEGYRVWHDLCHMDDALMAPVDTNHFDGYLQGPSTLTKYKPYEQVPGLNTGGWHDAGDYDLRVESQAGTVWVLTMAFEQFKPEWDQTLIDQKKNLVEMHCPDGKNDILQQIEHGLLTIVAGYKNLGRLYRGIIENDIRQYVHLGDAGALTDGLKFNPKLQKGEKTGTESSSTDDRWVFTENNPGRELEVAKALAAASRVMRDYNDTLSALALQTAEALYNAATLLKEPRFASAKIKAAIELLLATENQKYASDIILLVDENTVKDRDVVAHLGRIFGLIKEAEMKSFAANAANAYRWEIDMLQQENPFGVPYRPQIWGDGWNIQIFGVRQYFLQKYYSGIYDTRYLFNALNFILGCHPGENTSSFVSGVGSRSVTVAYGVNRADWSFIPGGSVSGTGIIRPDFPELKVWPYFWQQTEYVMGGGATNFMFLALAAQNLLEGKQEQLIKQ